LTPHHTRIDEKFTTPIIHGEKVYLEYHILLPDNPLDTIVPRIHIFKTVQGYRDVLVQQPQEKALLEEETSPLSPSSPDLLTSYPKGVYGNSESCNNDATCPLLGDEWEKVRHSVVQILTDGGSSGNQFSAVCTGTLINNANKKNYVLTAYHCLEGESVANWAFVFNYERECDEQHHHQSQSSRSKFKDFLNGAKLVWADKASDVILLEIYQDIPRHYNAYFAGWDASSFDFLDPYSVSFHHPSGDFKKVSVDSNAKGEGTCPFCGSLAKSHIVVTGWDDGSTERGSSGCSLMNSDQKVVGILSGGSASCPDGEGFDLFGKLEVAFERGLRDHLSGGVGPSSQVSSMEGEWNEDPKSTLMFQPQSLVVAENGPQKAFHIWLSEGVDRDDVVSISLSVPHEASHLIESLSPTDLRFTSEDWFKQKEIVITPKDNEDFDGDVRYYLELNVQHSSPSSSSSSYVSQYPVIHQDDEHISGDTLFDPIEIESLPFSFMGDTSSGYTNTYQSRCELGSASPDVAFEFTPKEDLYVSISLCSFLLFDSTLYVMENGKEKWCNDDGGQCAPSSELLNLLFEKGKTYHIIVDGYNGAKGRFQLEMNEIRDQYVDSFEGPDQYYDTAVPLDTFSLAPPLDTFSSGGSGGAAVPLDTFSIPRDTYTSAAGLAPIAKLKSDKEPEKMYSSDGDAASANAALPSGVPLRSILTFYNVLESTKTETEEGSNGFLEDLASSSSSSSSATTLAANLGVKMATFLGALFLSLALTLF
jgi:hypothetical protein